MLGNHFGVRYFVVKKVYDQESLDLNELIPSVLLTVRFFYKRHVSVNGKYTPSLIILFHFHLFLVLFLSFISCRLEKKPNKPSTINVLFALT